MTYIVSNIASGLVLGTYVADSPEDAILAMLADAGADLDEGISPNLVAVPA